MNTVELILVILLSVGFLTLIILSIVLVSLMLAIMRNLKRISDRAESATSNVAGIVESLSRKLAPVALTGIMTALMKRFAGKHGAKDE